MNVHRLLCTFLLLVISSSSILAQSLEEALIDIAQDHDLVGLSVAFICGENPPEDHHFGKANLWDYSAVDSNTKYRIASISKAVTASALMVLYDQGLFDLDDPVSDYLGFELAHPDFPEDTVTIRMLLSHTAGLRDGDGYFDFLSATYNNPDPPHLQELVNNGGDYYTSDLWGNQEPGKYFTYANINFGIIATLIENISDTRFDLFVRDELLLPLDISGSFNIQHIPEIEDVATLYRNGNPQVDNYQGTYPTPTDLSAYNTGTNGFIFAPQGGLRASAVELSRFIQMHLNMGVYNGNSILSEEAVQLLHGTQWTYNGTNGSNYYNLFNQWGLGFHKTTNQSEGDIVFPDYPMIGHPGEAYGLISDCYFNTEHQFGIVFLTNGYYTGDGYEFGNYSAFYTAEEAIFSTIENYLLTPCLSPSSTTENKHQTGYLIVPNPSSGNFQISGDAENIRIYAANGKLIYEQINYVANEVIVLPENEIGLFFVQIQNNGDTYYYKSFILSE